MDAVFEPETISKFEIVKLSGENTSKRRSKQCSGERVFRDTGWP